MVNRILHISTNDKFINSAIYQFEKVFPGKNVYRIIPKSKSEKLEGFDKDLNIELIREDLDTFLKKYNLSQYGLIVLHGLNTFMSRMVLKSNKNVNFLWILWGAEIYNNVNEPLGNNFGDQTRRIFKIKTTSNLIIKYLRYIKYRYKYNIDNFEILNAIKRIKYIGILHQEDFDLMYRKNILRKDAQYIKYSYYPLEFIFKGIENMNISNDNILVGNSAYPTNNHIEAFNLLKEFDLKDKKLIVPLSYGDSEYKSEIIKFGNKLFKNNFKPLLDFLPLYEYQKKMQQCGIVIMNNYRQQAVGNIVAMLWIGAKVYLDERNTFYHYLKRIGIIIFSVEKELKIENQSAFKLLENFEIEENRKILSLVLSEDILLRELKFEISSILKEN